MNPVRVINITAPNSVFALGASRDQDDAYVEPLDAEVLEVANELGLTARRLVDPNFPGEEGRWELRLDGVEDFAFNSAEDNLIAIIHMLEIAPLLDALDWATKLACEATATLAEHGLVVKRGGSE